MFIRRRQDAKIVLTFYQNFIFQKVFKTFFFRELIYAVFLFLTKRCEFAETTFFRRSARLSFYVFFCSNHNVFKNWNRRKDYHCWSFFRFHCVIHKFCFRRDFYSFFFHLFFEILKIKRFMNFFARLASSFWCLFLMKTFRELMFLRVICATLFIFANIRSMIIFLTFCALFYFAIFFIIFHRFYVWFYDHFQLNQFIRDFCIAYSCDH